MAKVLSQDGDMGSTHHYSHADDQTVIKTVQDVGPYLRKNAQERAHSSEGYKGDFHKVASIPLVVIEQWTKELGDDPLAKHNRKWFVAKLNNSDFLKLRTKEGRI